MMLGFVPQPNLQRYDMPAFLENKKGETQEEIGGKATLLTRIGTIQECSSDPKVFLCGDIGVSILDSKGKELGYMKF